MNFFLLLHNFKIPELRFDTIIERLSIILILSRYLFDKEAKTPIMINSLEKWVELSFSLYYVHFGVISVGIFLFSTFFNKDFKSSFPVHIKLM